MAEITKATAIGVIGAGAMGSGIAQVAATAGHEVILFDASATALDKAKNNLDKVLKTLSEKGKITESTAMEIFGRIKFASDLNAFSGCGLIIEAVVEQLEIKQSVFRELEKIVSPTCILATNTSSLSVVSIAAACQKPGRVMGIHFFNPPPLMPLVEIVPAITTDPVVLTASKKTIDSWGKQTVIAKDTPGFIVNRVARPFYGEAIRIYEEGIADVATIDQAIRQIGGFKMGPFELMDFIGNDINYKVTETVWEQLFYDPRYRPSITQKRLYEAGYFGRKSGKGYYDYTPGAVAPKPIEDKLLHEQIFIRVLVMLINEAADALYLNVASREDIDLAMTKGVNYPKGLLKWADEIGLVTVLGLIENLQNEYGEDRYRPSVMIKRLTKSGSSFYPIKT